MQLAAGAPGGQNVVRISDRFGGLSEATIRRCGACRSCAGSESSPESSTPIEVEALMAALRTRRDRAMVEAMLLAGMRRWEVLGLRLGDLRLGEWRVLVVEGKGGHQRLIPCREPSSPPWPPTSTTSARPTPPPIGDTHRPVGRTTRSWASARSRCWHLPRAR